MARGHVHANQPAPTRGAPLAEAGAAVLLLHGRGASAADILTLVDALDLGGGSSVAFVAPQAARGSWYPHSFLEPLERNQPHLDSALRVVEESLVSIDRAGVPARRTVLLGFSQGGCLALEFAARNARRYGALVGLSAGLIGPPGTRWVKKGSLEGTSVFLGCSDVDPHIPLSRVRETDETLRAMGGAVTTRIYPGAPHAVNADEVEAIGALLRRIDPRAADEVSSAQP